MYTDDYEGAWSVMQWLFSTWAPARWAGFDGLQSWNESNTNSWGG